MYKVQFKPALSPPKEIYTPKLSRTKPGSIARGQTASLRGWRLPQIRSIRDNEPRIEARSLSRALSIYNLTFFHVSTKCRISNRNELLLRDNFLAIFGESNLISLLSLFIRDDERTIKMRKIKSLELK